MPSNDDNRADQMNPNNDAYWESRNSDGNPDSPQVVVFLATIVDVTVGT